MDLVDKVIDFDFVVYIIAIPANRYDLLCIEGFTRAIRIFLNLDTVPIYKSITPIKREILYVNPSTYNIRPYCVAAILRGINFTPEIYKSFIDLQDKLHQNICRKRTYVAIGTHDYDTIQGPFYYNALKPNDINFVPLTENNNKSYNGKELLDFYREDSSTKHLKPYTDIIYDYSHYPLITDSNGIVLSLPPIINSKHSRITLETKNIFIECTGTDITKANIVLDTVVTMFSQYCQEKFTIEEVEIRYESEESYLSLSTSSLDLIPTSPTIPNISIESLLIPKSRIQITPLLSTRQCNAKIDDINNTIGVILTPSEICNLCNRMQLGPTIYDEINNEIIATIPPTRSDILHSVDIIEDIAIAYGYNNIPHVVPSTLTVGGPLQINLFTDLLRHEISREGYMEILTHGLCSIAENFTYLNHSIDLNTAVSLLNPANIEYEIVRTTLLPGILKTLAYNKSISHKDGIKLFEISDVVLRTNLNEIGCENKRRFVGLYSSLTSKLEVIHGLVDRIFRCSQIIPLESYGLTSLTSYEYNQLKKISRKTKEQLQTENGIEIIEGDICYYLQSNTDPMYYPGMGADIILRKVINNQINDSIIGTMGVLHPDVLNKYEISYPCSVVELDLEALL